MRVSGAWFATVGLLGMVVAPERAEAQAVAFFPQVGSLPDGVSMNATPAVSADRRYVRLSLGVGFQTVNGFQPFGIPAAVGGGGGGGGGGRGGAGGLGGLGTVPGAAGLLGGVRGLGPAIGPVDDGSGYPPYGNAFGQDLVASAPTPRRPRAPKARTVRARKALPDPTIVPSKKP